MILSTFWYVENNREGDLLSLNRNKTNLQDTNVSCIVVKKQIPSVKLQSRHGLNEARVLSGK